MINPISFLWRQFSGPQITAICQALWQYFVTSFDTILDYFNAVTPTTANTQHLTLLGSLHGLSRPLIPIPDEDKFIFVEPYDYELGYGVEQSTWTESHMIPKDAGFPSTHGLGSLNSRNTGGVFSDLADTTGYSHIADYIFRAFLQGSIDSEGYLGGLKTLDDMLYAAWNKDHPNTIPAYIFRWARLDINPTYNQADVFVDLGVSGDWAQPYQIQAEIKLLGHTVYYPIPRIIPVLTEGG